jgi:hypothetical protein
LSKKIFILLIFASSGFTTFGQGFDWQESNRTPFEIPKFYLGVDGSYSIYNQKTDLDFFIDKTYCCNFEEGKGSGYDLVIAGEYWIEGNIAIFGSLGYLSNVFNFSNNSSVKSKNQTLGNEYLYEVNLSSFTFEIGGKYRLPFWMVNVGASLGIGIPMTVNKIYSQIISGGGTSAEYNLENGRTPRFNKILYSISFYISRDINFSMPVYAQPYLGFSSSLTSDINSGKLNSFGIQIGVKVFYGLF